MRRRFYNAISDNPKCMIIEALEDGLTVSLEGVMSASTMEYSTDYIIWNKLKIGQYTTEINKGEQLLFRGKYAFTGLDKIKFVISKNCELKGSCMYLLGDAIAIKNNSLVNHSSAFEFLFENCTTIKKVSSGFLPATTLEGRSYHGMFYGCTGLTQAPELPATTLTDSCYNSMFEGCTSLTQAPALPAITLSSNCYSYMFRNCTSLTTAPELPATTLASSCYNSMFDGCTSLTQAPELPATTLASSCYYRMFDGCTSLTQAPELPATTLASSCYNSMFYGCTSLTQAPELPATTLTDSCYSYMFYGCSKLNYIKAMFTTTPSMLTTSSTFNWVYGVASTGRFIKNKNATWNATGTYAIPSGWSIQSAAQ